MTLSQALILIIAGLIAGFAGGTLGIGGGLIMIPTLVFILGLGQHEAQGTSIATMLAPIGIFAAYNYYKAGYVNVKFAIIMALTFLLGSYLGSKFSITLPDRTLKQIFGVLLLFVGFKMILGK